MNHLANKLNAAYVKMYIYSSRLSGVEQKKW